MSQRRAGQSKADNEQVTQIWHGIIDGLRQLPATDAASLQRLNALYPSATDVDVKHDQDWITAKTALAEDFEREEKLSEKQARILALAQEQIDILLALKRAPDGAVPTILGGAVNDASLKRKRARLSPSSNSLRLSPAITSASSPHPSGLATGGPRSASPAVTTTSAVGSVSAPSTKQRREALAGQLPLAPGRKVAFRVPNKVVAAAAAAAAAQASQDSGVGGGKRGADADEPREETWILARIERSINSDKSRYVVRDIDEEDSVYNTTIKSIVPLPDPTAPPNSPAHPNLYEDQPRGAQVLAIYPDTTSFYRATVLMPPIPGTGNGIGVKEQGLLGAKKGKYVLQFEDDDEKSKEVDAGLVVEYPGAN